MRFPRPAAPRLAWILAAFALAPASARPAAAAADLIARISVSRGPSWTAFIVPRASGDAVASDPLSPAAQLPANAPVWLNWDVFTNPAWWGNWTDGLYLDDAPIQMVPRYNNVWAAQDWFELNVGPVYVAGGRHKLTAHADVVGPVEDYSFQGDNIVNENYLWAPSPIAPGGVGLNAFAAPPPTAGQEPPNCEAWQVTRAAGVAWAISLRSAGGDDNLRLYDDYTDSGTGLSHELARSERGGDSLDLVVGAADAGAPTLYPASVRGAGAGAPYAIHYEDATGRFRAGADYEWSAETMPGGAEARVYELELEGGVGVPMSVWPVVGQSALAFSLFADTPGAMYRLSDALVTSHPIASQSYAAAYFTPPATGRYIAVVWREHNLDGYQPENYRLAIGSQAVSVEGAHAGLALAPPSPNPAPGSTLLRYTLPSAAHVRLAVYDAAGRLVRTLTDGEATAGAHAERFDLRNARGAALPPGLYLARLEALGRVLTTRLVALP